MGVLQKNAIGVVHHYTPLHYLPFIARTRALLGKPELAATGFEARHFRTKSKKQDVQRGFGSYNFMTLDRMPRILGAKLAAGFPHIGLEVSSSVVESVDFSLCRFNVAMTRQLRKAGRTGFSESLSNGRYYPGHQIPIARTLDDQEAMLRTHLKTGTMIEVLVHGRLSLPDDTKVICYARDDAAIAAGVLQAVGAPWHVEYREANFRYSRNEEYNRAVAQFVARALADPTWRGDGLEFDRV